MSETGTAGQKVIFDFSKREHGQGWQTVNDTVMGGVSEGEFSVTEDGTGLFSGTVSLEHSGGFASVRSPVGHHDLSAFSGIEIRVRGDGKRYRATATMDAAFDVTIYQAGLETEDGVWQTVRLAFSDFAATYHGRTLKDAPPLDAGRIASLGFVIADRQEGAFRLEVARIGAFRRPNRLS